MVDKILTSYSFNDPNPWSVGNKLIETTAHLLGVVPGVEDAFVRYVDFRQHGQVDVGGTVTQYGQVEPYVVSFAKTESVS